MRRNEALPWESDVPRVVIQAANYLDHEGAYSAGGRQRYIRDLAEVIRDLWRRDVLIVQKGARDFEVTCPHGFRVIGLKSNLRAYGDPGFSHKAKKIVRHDDGLIYASGEDSWPVFRAGAKAVQHGVWWDGPQSRFVRFVQRRRAISCLKAVRSMLCVDTNFINWLRCQGPLGYRLCRKCVYIPNYADGSSIDSSPVGRRDARPLSLICARRHEEKRGISLFLRSLQILKKEGFPFSAAVYSPTGLGELISEILQLDLSDCVTAGNETMDGILNRYQSADVAVVPTLWSEGTSLACIEAVCAGLPVIATPVGGLGNIVIPEFNGVLVSPDPTAIATAIKRFADPGYLEPMRRNCLSLKPALGIETWRQKVVAWLSS